MEYNHLISLEDFLALDLRGANSVIGGVFGKEEFSAIPEHIMKAAIERGKAVHEAIENFINTGVIEIDFEYQIYIDYFNDWLKEYEPEFLCSELKLYSHELGYKGIVDTLFIAENKCGERVLVMADWKTSSNLNVFKAGLQLTLYVKLINHLKETSEYIQNLLEDNEIKELRVLSLTRTGYKYILVPYDMKTADSLLYLYHEKIKYPTGKIFDLM